MHAFRKLFCIQVNEGNDWMKGWSFAITGLEIFDKLAF